LGLDTGTALAQTLGQGGDDGVSLWRVIAALLLCIVLGVVAAFVLRTRLGHRAPFSLGRPRMRRLQLVETLRLGHQVDLCIVTCDGHELLVAASAHGTQLLERVPSNASRGPEPAP
jgi:flagellar biogenesis protein FliO